MYLKIKLNTIYASSINVTHLTNTKLKIFLSSFLTMMEDLQNNSSTSNTFIAFNIPDEQPQPKHYQDDKLQFISTNYEFNDQTTTTTTPTSQSINFAETGI
jgi:hypothetical protein